MTRNGKIARLPRHIRDELNQRLDNGEPAVRLVDWLNNLPEVQKVLETEFESRPINESNISEWKKGGYLEWQAQRETHAELREFYGDSEDLSTMAADLANKIEALLLARYAIILKRTRDEMTDELLAQLQYVGKSLRDFVRYGRYGQARERTQIQRETLDLKRQKTDEGQRKKFLELTKDPKIQDKLTPKMTREEKAAALEAYLFPKTE